MANTYFEVPISEELNAQLKEHAKASNQTPQQIAELAIHAYINNEILKSDAISSMQNINDKLSIPKKLPLLVNTLIALSRQQHDSNYKPFQHFLTQTQRQVEFQALRKAIIEAYRLKETVCVSSLLEEARLANHLQTSTHTLAKKLVEALRNKQSGGGVEGLIHEFSLSSQEGVALMCLAEALLRIPDSATRDALIRDKISKGNWRAHLGNAPSLFVNATTWGLMITGKLVSINSETGLSAALSRLISRGGEPLVRKGVDMAMRLMGEQFVTGETVKSALDNSRKYTSKGFSYSYDMLGEAAATAQDAKHYYELYEQAIHEIGARAAGLGIYNGPGISIKLSALHPRYTRSQYQRVFDELLPRVLALANLARRYDIGLNIDAEETDRLDLSLDILESICFHDSLKGWNGIGFVVQAYQKRCPFVINYLIDLARRSQHRLMVRLVKGAYWDSEIKRAQVDGLEDYPVYTRKIYTDICYLACAKKLLAAPDAVYPQFATHNAQTLASIYHLAGQNYYHGQYEFQCLHGMGETLYEEVVGKNKLNRPCRIYAPVGTHETLLAYLVRRLLENGANTSFVNRIADRSVPVEDLIINPVDAAEKITPLGAPHTSIALPKNLYGKARDNSTGFDFSNENGLSHLSDNLQKNATHTWLSMPTTQAADWEPLDKLQTFNILNPACHNDVVGQVVHATSSQVEKAVSYAVSSSASWAATLPAERAAYLQRAADIYEEKTAELLGILIREAGKSAVNAIAEVREAVDFLRYYAAQIAADFTNETHLPLGPVVCISPWNFPLAIFTGQIAAALAAGNTVLAKPAGQTPIIAAFAVKILHDSGIPADVLQLLPGGGQTVGASLIAHPKVNGVMFTGSTQVAQSIAKTLAERISPQGQSIPLIAETGGQNVMIVDSSALAEQVVADVLLSAFDSAGQRCSALRVLCLQEDIAERTLAMLKGAMQELKMGNPEQFNTDIGPVIDAAAKRVLNEHIASFVKRGANIFQVPLPDECKNGTFVSPTLIEIENLDVLKHEVFGPILHVVRYRRDALDTLLEAIRRTGYGLTMGIHTRIDETVTQIVDKAAVGNIYINRNMVGAVVGVQPFGGEGLSGTGPKAGGPIYLYRLLSSFPAGVPPLLQALFNRTQAKQNNQLLTEKQLHYFTIYRNWLLEQNNQLNLSLVEPYQSFTTTKREAWLDGPTGETNTYTLIPRGTIFGIPTTEQGVLLQILTALSSGNKIILSGQTAAKTVSTLPTLLLETIEISQISLEEAIHTLNFQAVLCELDEESFKAVNKRLADRPGELISSQNVLFNSDTSKKHYALGRLFHERVISVNTAAAGGNASLMTIS